MQEFPTLLATLYLSKKYPKPDHENPRGPGIISGDSEAWPEQFKIIPHLLKLNEVFHKYCPKM